VDNRGYWLFYNQEVHGYVGPMILQYLDCNDVMETRLSGSAFQWCVSDLATSLQFGLQSVVRTVRYIT